MKLKGAMLYAIVALFLGWCAYAFRADIAQIRFTPVWAARDAVFVAALLSLLNYALRVARWSFYLSRLGHSLSISFVGLTYIAGFAFTLSPGKVGEMVRSRYYQQIGIPFSSIAAAFFVERLMDLLAMLTLAFVAIATVSTYQSLMLGAATVILLMLAIFTVSPWMKVFEHVESRTWISESLKGTAKGILRTLLSAKTLLQPQLFVAGYFIGLIAWGSEGIGLMTIGAIAPGVSIDWGTAIGIYSVAIIVGALSFLPGGLGSTEAVMIALLASHGYSIPDAILLTVVCRLLTLWFAVSIGWIAVAILRKYPMIGEVSQ